VKQFKNNYRGEEWSSSFVKRHRLRKSPTNGLQAEVSKATINKYSVTIFVRR